ncbi:MAG: acetate/propionate family kinase [Candidatus Auribacterota bacterium]|jgi:acetate kinase|nr:acetate/propionate family kinase [Candidatus Auribacterota bacterium]
MSVETMNILVFNCGSSSLKYKLIAMPSEIVIAGGEAQRVGPKTAEPSKIFHRIDGNEYVHVVEMPDHFTAFKEVMKLLTSDPRLIPHAVGHRVVHGATLFNQPTCISLEVLEQLKSIEHLAPLHNPPAMRLMEACTELYPELPQVAVFDTAYHATIPDYASTYAISSGIADEMGIRKYGFHGTSHQFVVEEAAAFLKKDIDSFNAVSCHLGSGGASLCAVKNGKSVDNTMGFSPLQGLVMSTRCGDLDSAVALKLIGRYLGDTDSVEKLLNKQSGVLGMSGVSADIRDIFNVSKNYTDSTSKPDLTAQVYLWRIRKYLGSYLTVVENADAIIFTDTIGETVPLVRWAVCTNMEYFGVEIDTDKNSNVKSYPVDVATPNSRVRILVILTNEELAISRRTYAKLFQPQGTSTGRIW